MTTDICSPHRIRTGALSGFAELVVALGGQPQALLLQAGLAADQLTRPDEMIAVSKFSRLLTLAAEQLDRPEFGLQLASGQRISILGPAGQLINDKKTVAEAVDIAHRYLMLHSPSETWRATAEGGLLIISHFEHYPQEAASIPHRELSLQAAYQVLREVNPEILPRRVCFTHKPTSPLRVYQHYFGCDVLFNQDQDLLVYEQRILTLPLLAVSEKIGARNDQLVEQLISSHHESTERKVRALIMETLTRQTCDIDSIAKLLGIHTRALQRQLKEEGIQYRQVLLDARMQLASWHLLSSDTDITRLADLLGYQDATAFSRAFRREKGHSPSQYRRLNEDKPHKKKRSL
jgi:AraC-like DNA-binding protein